MTPLDQTASDRPEPAPAAPGPGTECSVVAGAGAGAGGTATAASVPQPRLSGGRCQEPADGGASVGSEDAAEAVGSAETAEAGAQGRTTGGTAVTVPSGAKEAAASRADRSTGPSAVTARNLRAGLGARLRSAYERGATIAELSSACRRTDAETRELLLAAGADLFPEARRNPPDARDARVPREPVERSAESTARAAGPAVRSPAPGGSVRKAGTASRWAPTPPPVPPAAGSAPAASRPRRPSPARRLSRLHHRGEQPGNVPEQRSASPADRPAGFTGSTDPTVPAGPTGPETSKAPSETPLGILIGGTPDLPEPENRPRERRFVRVDARTVRVGRGTCLVVLPSWRPAIAVSVPTEQLLAATGLGFDRLSTAALSVFIDPEALHDRELGLHGWRTGPAKRGGARSRRS